MFLYILKTYYPLLGLYYLKQKTMASKFKEKLI